jgi:hypothetical protein
LVSPQKKEKGKGRAYSTASSFIAGHLLTAVINSLAYLYDWGLAFDHVLFLKQVKTDIKKNDNIATALDIVLSLLGNPVIVYPSVTEMGFPSPAVLHQKAILGEFGRIIPLFFPDTFRRQVYIVHGEVANSQPQYDEYRYKIIFILKPNRS